MTEPTDTAKSIVSMCKLGWCSMDSEEIASDLELKIPEADIQQLHADLLSTGDLNERHAYLNEALKRAEQTKGNQ